jgi:hypothetical protein
MAAWAIAWALPLTLGYHASMVVYAIGLHAWFHESADAGWAGFAEKTGARFFLSPCPVSSTLRLTGLARWVGWWCVLITWHFVIARMFVVGLTDNGCHDAHHADPRGRNFDWCNAAYARSDYMNSRPQAKLSFWHTWSLNRAISDNFDRLAASAAQGTLTRAPDGEVAVEETSGV